MASILFLGTNSGTGRHRALALRRLGHRVAIIDPRAFLPKSRFADYWIFHTGALFCLQAVRHGVLRSIERQNFDLVWVDGGDLVSPSLVRDLKTRYGTVLNYCIDDPYGTRDGSKWRAYLASVPLYDLLVVLRNCNIEEAYQHGAQRVIRVYMTADEIAHTPQYISEEEKSRHSMDVAFIGTWMPERGPFLLRLLDLQVPLFIYGDRWDKSPEWSRLKSAWRGPGLYSDREYAVKVQCAQVCIGLLSKGNRDESTTRSFEIPSLQSVLCAERTSEHLSLYREDEEAVFWSSAEECAAKCRKLLENKQLRDSIACAGRTRFLRNRTSNEAVLEHILLELKAGMPIVGRATHVYTH
jgi:spore maturation protein CgeB